MESDKVARIDQKEIKQLEAVLTYNQFTAHTVRNNDNVARAVKRAKELIKSSSPIPAAFTLLSKQVALYYLFCVPDKIQAPHYAFIYKSLTKRNSLDHADACYLLGIAYAMDPHYKALTTFETALSIYVRKGDKIGEAIAYRYLALMHLRQSFIPQALDTIQKAISLENSLIASNSLIKMELAKSLHIHGMILHYLAEQQTKSSHSLHKANTNFKLAEEKFLLAEKHADSTPCMTFSRTRSLAMARLRLHQNDDAMTLLQKTYPEQVTYYNTTAHVDIAETLHAMGEVYAYKQEYEKALHCHLEAYLINQQFYKKDHPAFKSSQSTVNQSLFQLSHDLDNLVHSFNTDFRFDWNDVRHLKESMEKAEKVKLFIQFIDETCSALLSSKAKQELGQLCYKLGTFYNCMQDPEQAINALSIAVKMLEGDMRVWAESHFAFSYQQRLANAIKKGQDEETSYQLADTAIEYVYQVITPNKDDAKCTPQIAFAKSTAALIHYEIARYCAATQPDKALSGYQYAIEDCNFALSLYEKMRSRNNQFANAKLQLAVILDEYAILLGKQDRLFEGAHARGDARKIFEELEIEWEGIQDPHPIYAALFYITYADSLAKSREIVELRHAISLYKKAQEMFLQVEGKDSLNVKYVSIRLTNTTDRLSLQETSTRRTHEFFSQPKIMPSSTTPSASPKQIKPPY